MDISYLDADTDLNFLLNRHRCQEVLIYLIEIIILFLIDLITNIVDYSSFRLCTIGRFRSLLTTQKCFEGEGAMLDLKNFFIDT